MLTRPHPGRAGLTTSDSGVHMRKYVWRVGFYLVLPAVVAAAYPKLAGWPDVTSEDYVIIYFLGMLSLGLGEAVDWLLRRLRGDSN